MKTDVLIIGAGITGLSCAYHLKRDYAVFEKESLPGGVCCTDKVKGFSFDRAEHFIRIPNEKVLRFFRKIAGDDLFSQRLISSIYYGGRFIPYPFQKNIYYLSDKDKFRCFKSFIKRKNSRRINKKISFGEWALASYGEWMAKNFIFPYNKKIWQIDPYKMRSDFLFDPRLIPHISLDEMLEYIFLSQEERKEDHVQYRYYMKRGGIGAFSDKLASKIDNIHFGKRVKEIDLKRKEAVTYDGTACRYNTLISTIPITEFVRIARGIPITEKNLAKRLKYSSMCIFNFALKKTLDFSQHWIYFPEPAAPFVRTYFLKNFDVKMCPKGKSSISVVYSYMPHKKIDFPDLEKKIIDYLSKHAFFSSSDIEFIFKQLIQYGMPIPAIGSDVAVKRIDEFLTSHSVKTIGRYGLWKYQGIEHAVQDGQNINSILKGLRS